MRRRFDEQGNFFDTHGDYPDVVREISVKMNVALIDLHKSSRELIEHLGVEKSKEIFLWVKPGEYAGYADGKEDNTHFTEYGAQLIACIVVWDLANLDLNLDQYLVNVADNCF